MPLPFLFIFCSTVWPKACRRSHKRGKGEHFGQGDHRIAIMLKMSNMQKPTAQK